jgi:phosphate transport system permease protein
VSRLPLRRRVPDLLCTCAVWAAVALALFPLLQLGVLVVAHALPALGLRLFVEDTQGTGGGLRNALVGTFFLVALANVLAVPVGVAAGVYVAEVGSGPFVRIVRLAADVLAGVPSIAVGYVGYVALVTWLGWGFSALAGGIALALIMLPYVVRATDYAVSGVPAELRDASLALGVSPALTVRHVVLRAARPGIATGVLLATAVAVGETAPLLYTASWSNFLPTGALFHSPVGYLTYVVWTFAEQPFSAAHALAYAAALLLMVVVLGLNVLARAVLRGPGV